jgi:uncharacterized membrane protein
MVDLTTGTLHSEAIDEAAHLVGKYMKTIVQNSKYSRIALGLPGTLMLIWIVLAILRVDVYYYAIALLLVLSTFMLIKGFGVDRAAKNFYRWAKDYSPPPLPVQISNYAAIAGILCIVVSIYAGYANAVEQGSPLPVTTGGWLSALPLLSAYFLQGAVYLVIVGLCTVMVGRSVRMYFAHDVRVLRNFALIVSLAWSSVIFNGAAEVIIKPSAGLQNLVFYIIVGILIAIASVLVMLIIHRSYKGFFVKSNEKADEFEED